MKLTYGRNLYKKGVGKSIKAYNVNVLYRDVINDERDAVREKARRRATETIQLKEGFPKWVPGGPFTACRRDRNLD